MRSKINWLVRMAKSAPLLWQEFTWHLRLKAFCAFKCKKVMECVLYLNMEEGGPTHSLYVADSESMFVDFLGLGVWSRSGQSNICRSQSEISF